MGTSIKDIEQEEDEMLLRIEADTVIHPRAVMIHSSNASLANGAVMRMWWLYRIALLALLGHNFINESDISCINHDSALLLIII